MSLLSIRWTSRRTSPSPVVEAQVVARVQPRHDAHQRIVRQGTFETHPPSRDNSWTDYFGTRVTAFGVTQAHEELEVTFDVVVETRPRPPAGDAPVDALTDRAFSDDHAEYLAHSPAVRWKPAFLPTVAALVSEVGADDVASLARALSLAVTGALTLGPADDEQGSRTFAGVILASGAATDAEAVHAVIGALRVAGIPARLVTGFLADDDSVDEDGLGNVTAWIEIAVPGSGWFAFDPFTGVAAGEDHVDIAMGRDATDCPSLRTSWTGPADHELVTGVRIQHLDA